MTFMERLAARYLLTVKFAELHEDEFETFFHDLMCLRFDDFADVRTAGNLGDMGSDGLSLYSRKIYACYGPHAFDEAKLKSKFDSDLLKAFNKRKGQFDIFVFVNNDRRGMHPKVSSLVADAVRQYSPIRFENFGFRKFRDELMRLERHQVEDLIQIELPIAEMAYGIGIEEVAPLLDHLNEYRVKPPETTSIESPSELKLDYNEFGEDTKEEIVRSLAIGARIDEYYSSRVDITERDEVAAGFREEYLRLRAEYDDPEEIIWRLEQYILGNASCPWKQQRAAKALLTYFFQTCDIFDNPPVGWTSIRQVGSAT